MSDPRILDTATYDAMQRRVSKAIRHTFDPDNTARLPEDEWDDEAAAAITAVLSSLAYSWPLRPGRNAPGAPEAPQENAYLTRRDLMELADQTERKNRRSSMKTAPSPHPTTSSADRAATASVNGSDARYLECAHANSTKMTRRQPVSRRPLDVADDIDPVAVQRAINGTNVGRPLHHAEKVHIAVHYPQLNLPVVLGCSTDQVRQYQHHNTRQETEIDE